MPRSDDDVPRRRHKEKHKLRDRSSSRERRDHRDRHYKKIQTSSSTVKHRSRSPSFSYKKSYDRSPESYRSSSSHRSSRRKSSHHSSGHKDKKSSSQHRRSRSSSRSSTSRSVSSDSSVPSRAQSKNRSLTPEQIFKKSEITGSKAINLESSSNEQLKKQLLEEIEQDSFVPKTFSSSSSVAKKAMGDKVIIDLQKETISVSKADITELDDQIIHPNFLGDDEDRMDRWIRKLFIYRQKYAE